MIHHVAMFRFRDDVDDATISTLRADLLALPDSIGSIRSYQVGLDLGLISGSWHMVVVAGFDDEAGYLAYRNHPDHTPVVARVGELTIERASLQTTQMG